MVASTFRRSKRAAVPNSVREHRSGSSVPDAMPTQPKALVKPMPNALRDQRKRRAQQQAQQQAEAVVKQAELVTREFTATLAHTLWLRRGSVPPPAAPPPAVGPIMGADSLRIAALPKPPTKKQKATLPIKSCPKARPSSATTAPPLRPLPTKPCPITALPVEPISDEWRVPPSPPSQPFPSDSDDPWSHALSPRVTTLPSQEQVDNAARTQSRTLPGASIFTYRSQPVNPNEAPDAKPQRASGASSSDASASAVPHAKEHGGYSKQAPTTHQVRVAEDDTGLWSTPVCYEPRGPSAPTAVKTQAKRSP